MGVHGLPPDLLITADPPERTGAAGGTRKGSLPFLRALRRGTGTLWKTELRRRPPARGGRFRKGVEENDIVETNQKSRIDSGRFVQNGKRQRLRIDLPNNFLKFFRRMLKYTYHIKRKGSAEKKVTEPTAPSGTPFPSKTRHTVQAKTARKTAQSRRKGQATMQG